MMRQLSTTELTLYYQLLKGKYTADRSCTRPPWQGMYITPMTDDVYYRPWLVPQWPYQRTLSRAAYLAIKNAIVAATVALTDTMTVPGNGPNMTPAVIVRGIAGTASTSNPAYTTAYAT
eukprot:GHUV01032777.1.p3 GENE.GHUV01032777.1~~GHUV01032777.1.p3  ORF type:complete len:119 (+),score=16.06 GHUV01032777.1:815-1171(+)